MGIAIFKSSTISNYTKRVQAQHGVAGNHFTKGVIPKSNILVVQKLEGLGRHLKS